MSDRLPAALNRSLGMPRFERRQRMRSLHRTIREADVDAWMHNFLNAMDDVSIVKSLAPRLRRLPDRYRRLSHAV